MTVVQIHQYPESRIMYDTDRIVLVRINIHPEDIVEIRLLSCRLTDRHTRRQTINIT